MNNIRSNITAEKLNRSNKSVMTCHEDLVMRKFERKKKQQDKKVTAALTNRIGSKDNNSTDVELAHKSR
jgi:hypothetical protein